MDWYKSIPLINVCSFGSSGCFPDGHRTFHAILNRFSRLVDAFLAWSEMWQGSLLLEELPSNGRQTPPAIAADILLLLLNYCYQRDGACMSFLAIKVQRILSFVVLLDVVPMSRSVRKSLDIPYVPHAPSKSAHARVRSNKKSCNLACIACIHHSTAMQEDTADDQVGGTQ